MIRLAALAAALVSLAHASLAAGEAGEGEQLFTAHCGFCHLVKGIGTVMLARRLGPEHALLAERTDLTPDYVKQVVRHGLSSMPPLTRVEVPDSDLSLIAGYLGKADRPSAPPSVSTHGP